MRPVREGASGSHTLSRYSPAPSGERRLFTVDRNTVHVGTATGSRGQRLGVDAAGNATMMGVHTNTKIPQMVESSDVMSGDRCVCVRGYARVMLMELWTREYL